MSPGVKNLILMGTYMRTISPPKNVTSYVLNRKTARPSTRLILIGLLDYHLVAFIKNY